MKKWLSISEGSEYSGVSEKTFRSWLKQGLRHSRVSAGLIRVRVDAVDDFLQSFETDTNEASRICDQVISGIKSS